MRLVSFALAVMFSAVVCVLASGFHVNEFDLKSPESFDLDQTAINLMLAAIPSKGDIAGWKRCSLNLCCPVSFTCCERNYSCCSSSLKTAAVTC